MPNLVALTAELIRNLPRLIAVPLNEVVRTRHAPEWMGDELVCLRCKRSAPCAPWMDASEEIARLRGHAGGA